MKHPESAARTSENVGCREGAELLRSFVDKAVRLIRSGIHSLIVDLFPPNLARDPQGLQGVIWDQFSVDPFTLPADKPLTQVSYLIGGDWLVHLEFAALGDPLPDVPWFATRDEHALVQRNVAPLSAGPAAQAGEEQGSR